ncbi:MAG TPA: hypothetical protein VHO50_05950 [Bacteroidales bacterium]|nr:hypothetical protein [Bacteroidales bacterium]
MKRLLISLAAILMIIPAVAQADRTEILTNLEKDTSGQVENQSATLKSAARLFGEKDDLTAVLMIIPSGSSVTIIDSDSTYYLVNYNETKGYVFKKQAVIDTNREKAIKTQPADTRSNIEQKTSALKNRLELLTEKYGVSIATKINSGKIWKGMTPDMVTDSWGSPQKINRIINGNTLKEEWEFKSTMLYFENNVLSDWGPVKK